MNVLRKSGKVLLWLIAGLLGLILLGLLILALVYPPEYIYRVLAWQESDYGDYMNNFPQRGLKAASEPFIFEMAADEERVGRVFETNLNVDDFDAFLEEGGAVHCMIDSTGLSRNASCMRNTSTAPNATRC